MTGRKQAIALSGMILFGGSFGLSTTAAAYGQQWRPAAMPLASGHNGAFRRIANSPSFRPRATFTSKRYQQPDEYRPAPARFAAAHARVRPTPPARPAPPAMPHRYGFPTAAHTAPFWQAPMATMAQFWPSSRPGYQPYYGHSGADPRLATGRMQARPAPRMLGYRPASTVQPSGYRNWRPTPPVQAARVQPAQDQVSHYAMRRQPVFRSNQVVGSATRVARPVGLSPTSVRAVQRSWRPTAASGALASSPSPSAFRPVAYGRPAAASARVASRLPSTSAGDVRRQLPGWVTTLSDSHNGDLCSWCGGS